MLRRAAGVNIPLFSLRTTKSLGTGEFYDLIPFIDWVKGCGLKWIQLLPIHDTQQGEGDGDWHPYDILSTFSLHPLYLNIQELAPEFEDQYRPIMKALNLPRLNYKKALFAKLELLRMIYLIRGEQDLNSEAFKRFFKKRALHLKPYAAYCVLRERFGIADFKKWGGEGLYSELLVDEICEGEEVGFHYFVQFHLDQQLKKVVAYAKAQGIVLKGDFTMGVHSDSVDAWRFNEYFKWDVVMGAPADFYNAFGQNWEFPSYNWEEVKAEKYYWFKERLKWMESYFEAIRLDHVLGYFRLWEIPKGASSALSGEFFPAESFWEKEGEKKLQFIREHTEMVLCAEDIGVIPDCVATVLKRLKILNLHVQRMPKSFNLIFEDPKNFPKLSVCMPSNHDTQPLRQWWKDLDEKKRKIYFDAILKMTGTPPSILGETLVEKIVQAHLESKSELAIFLLQDLLALNDEWTVADSESERINDPSNRKNRWNWRCHLYVEELLLAKSFQEKIHKMIREADR